MRVEISADAEMYVRSGGGRLWVWAERPLFCCWGSPVLLKASTTEPDDVSGFVSSAAAGLDIVFRAPGGRFPDVLEIALVGKRRARVEAYWDGCLMVM